MLAFLRGVLATIVGLILFIVLGLIIVVAVASSEDEVKIEDKSVLHLKLDRPIVERESESEVALDLLFEDESIGLINVVNAIQAAAEDDKIEGIYLEPKFLMGGYAGLKEIRDALLAFRESGKWVLAYSEMFTEKDYYLASAADQIYLTPTGMLELNGLASEMVFLKGTLDKLGVEPQIFRVGDYKSAIEPLIRKEMSEASREQVTSYLNSMYTTFLAEVAESRGLQADQLEKISDEMQVRNPEDARRLKIVDGLAYVDQVRDEIRQRLELEEDDDEEEDLPLVSYRKYNKSRKGEGNKSRDRIAVLVANGDIMSGKGNRQTIGSDSFVEELRKLRENDRVKAVVLRINSPGGSALASDVMWREIQLTKAVKPVIASMGDVAASGGYYMAMGCDTIVAQPNTITGSIGIFGVIFNMQNLLNDKLGITTDVVETGELSNLYKVTRPLTEYERSIVQESVEEGYETFTSKAAEGRHMPIDQLKEVAGGRVWTGVEAKEHGLVDVLGGLDEAIAIAVTKAGLEEDEYRLRYYPEIKSPLEEILGRLEEDAEVRFMQHRLGEYYPMWLQLEKVKNLQGIQARMPFELHIN